MATESKAPLWIGVAYLAGLVALCVQLGRLADNAWVGILCFVGVIAVHFAASRASEGDFSGVFWIAWAGAWAISAAAATAEYAGRWLWAIPWAIVGLLLVGIGAAAHRKSSWITIGVFALGFWSLAWTVVGPLWLYGKDREETQQWAMDVLRDWWWIPVAIIVVGFVVGLVVAGVGLMRDRAQSRKREQKRRALAQRHRVPAVPARRPVERNRPILATPAFTKPAPHQKPASPTPWATDRTPRSAPETIVRSTQPEKKMSVLDTAGDDAATVYLPSGATSETIFAGPTSADGVLYSVPAPVIDLVTSTGDFFALTEDGSVSRWHDEQLTDVPGVHLNRPEGLDAGGAVIVAGDRDKRLVSIRYGAGPRPHVQSHRVDYTVGCFAVNPFGTIVAYAPAQKPSVFAVVIATGDSQVLSEDVGSTSAMAFSADGRFLALGGKDGRVRMFDMATRQVTDVLDPPGLEHTKVVSVAQYPDAGWIAGYGGGRVVHWNSTGKIQGVAEERHHVSALAVGARSGKVAVGCADGHVVLHPADLGSALRDDLVAQDRIVGLSFEEGEDVLVAAAHDGTVRRIRL